MDKLSRDTFGSIVETTASIAASRFAYLIQENTYNRPNNLEGVSQFLHNPDYLTSFTYPLTLMLFMNSVFNTAKLLDKETGGNKIMQATMDFLIKTTPMIVISLNTWYELSSRPTYHDHPMIDILAGFTAGLAFCLTTPKERRPKKEIV